MQAATKLAKGGSHLVDVCPAPLLIGASPSPWTAGASVTISGVNLTGFTSATVGGMTPTSYTTKTDTTITGTMPAAGSGGPAVTTPCGSA